MNLRRWWPRRAGGLPPGQRLLTEMPRFSNAPLRAAPAIPHDPTVELRWPAGTVVLRLDELAGRPATEVVADFHCVTTWSVRDLRWSGVLMRDLVRDLVGDDVPAHALVTGGDGAAARFVVDDLLAENVVLATHLDGEPIPLRHGAPLRLITPDQYGYKHVKHVVRIEFTSTLPDGHYGAKEHLRGRVALEERHERLPNWLLRRAYRVTVPPTAIISDRTHAKHPQGWRG